jgi:Nucleotidyltransferase
MSDRLARGLLRSLQTLAPYLDEMVLIGGWVPYLYRRFGGFAEWRSGIALTAEADVLIASPTAPGERPPIAELLAHAGFHASSDGAVWETGGAGGEKIEFFVRHAGTQQAIGRPTNLPAQPGIGAVTLTDLELLAAHTRRLVVPVPNPAGPELALTVRLPTLGAYVVTKAATFHYRTMNVGGSGRRAKDIVYIRDVMAAGPGVSRVVESDIAEIMAGTGRSASIVRTATNNLGTLASAAGSAMLREAAEMLVQRDGVSLDAAAGDVRGHAADLREMLGE